MTKKEKLLQKAAEHMKLAKQSRPDKMTEKRHQEQAARLITKANK